MIAKEQLTQCDATGLSYIHYAAAYRNPIAVTSLLEKDRDLASMSDQYLWKWTALHWVGYVSQEGDQAEEVAIALLDAGADVNSKSRYYWTPLHLASCYGSLKVLTCLLSNGADPIAYSMQNWNPLHVAAIHGRLLHMTQLIEKNKEAILAVDNDLNTPAHLAAMNGKLEALQLLEKESGVESIHRPAKLNRYPIHLAAWYGRLSVVKHIVSQLSDVVDIGDKQNLTPLMYACRKPEFSEIEPSNSWTVKAVCYEPKDVERYDVAKFLLEQGADIKKRDNGDRSIPGEWKWQWSPLHYAAHSGSLGIAMLLIQSGAAIDDPSLGNWTALHEAACYGHTAVLKLLLSEKALKNVPATQGWTALHLAAMRGHKECCEALIQAGAAIDRLDDNFMTAAHLAACNDHHSILQLFYEYENTLQPKSNLEQINSSSIFEAVDCRGRLPVHLAAWHGHTQSVKWFYERFPHQTDAVDKSGNTALAYACSFPAFLRTMNKESVTWAHTLIQSPLGDKAKTVALLLNSDLENYKYTLNNNNESPLLHATRSNYVHIAILILRYLVRNITSQLEPQTRYYYLTQFLDGEFYRTCLTDGNDDISIVFVYCYHYLKAHFSDYSTAFESFAQAIQNDKSDILRERQGSSLPVPHNVNFFFFKKPVNTKLSHYIFHFLAGFSVKEKAFQECQNLNDEFNRNILHYWVLLVTSPDYNSKAISKCPTILLEELVSTKDYRGQSPLHLASLPDNSAVIGKFLKHLNSYKILTFYMEFDEFRHSPLHYLSIHGH